MSEETKKSDIVRRSGRLVKKKQIFSPQNSSVNCDKNKKAHTSAQNIAKVKSCSVCKNPFYWKKNQSNGSKKVQNVCSICTIKASVMQKKINNEKMMLQQQMKEKYTQDAKNFGKSLKEVLQDPAAERLYCPRIKMQPCACIQKYVLIDVNESQKKAAFLFEILKEAKRLSRLKCYSKDKLSHATENGDTGKKTAGIGLGNGQKRSKEFEQFVLEKRKYLRDELKLCESACQKVLFYSNNFLHKKLKTEPERQQRIEPKKAKALCDISTLSSETCCPGNCVLIAATHGTLLLQWRERAGSSQADAWKVIAEMLTPAGGGKINCSKFVQKVTGCSLTTISKVYEQMALTGGDREPPEHGLKKWYQDQARNETFLREPDEQEDHYEPLIPQSHVSNITNSLVRNIPISLDNNLQREMCSNIPGSNQSSRKRNDSPKVITLETLVPNPSVTDNIDSPENITDLLCTADQIEKSRSGVLP